MTPAPKSLTSNPHPVRCLVAALTLGSAAACGPSSSGVMETAGDAALGTAFQAACVNNNVATQALTVENGVCQNGLATIGLVPASPSGAAFAAWFNQDASAAAILMPYLYSCAAPAGQVVTWTNPATLVPYTWTGGLGLAPSWAAGNASTVAEQQAVTACLAARINKYGVHVPVAIEGRTAPGARIAIGANELTTYSVREGCFFGNLFNGDGAFVGLDHGAWDAATSSARACALDPQFTGSSTECPPLFQVGACAQVCRPDATNTFYESCTWGGKTYTRPVVTRLRPADVYRCGDGVCQMTEHCGNGSSAGSCSADCGECP